MKKIGFALLKFFVFFGLVAFVVTCSFLLFLYQFDMDRNILERNAKFTFFNVIFLSVIFCIVDMVRRKIMVDRPLKK